jgi:hypothetical protein
MLNGSLFSFDQRCPVGSISNQFQGLRNDSQAGRSEFRALIRSAIEREALRGAEGNRVFREASFL